MKQEVVTAPLSNRQQLASNHTHRSLPEVLRAGNEHPQARRFGI
jgi:hypothetical protein